MTVHPPSEMYCQKLIDSLNIYVCYRHRIEWREWFNEYCDENKIQRPHLDIHGPVIKFDSVLRYICDCLQLNFVQVQQSCINGSSNYPENSKEEFIEQYLVSYFDLLRTILFETNVFLRFKVKGRNLQLVFDKGTTIGDFYMDVNSVLGYNDSTPTFDLDEVKTEIVTDCVCIKIV